MKYQFLSPLIRNGCFWYSWGCLACMNRCKLTRWRVQRRKKITERRKRRRSTHDVVLMLMMLAWMERQSEWTRVSGSLEACGHLAAPVLEMQPEQFGVFWGVLFCFFLNLKMKNLLHSKWLCQSMFLCPMGCTFVSSFQYWTGEEEGGQSRPLSPGRRNESQEHLCERAALLS